ncbi:hypothetical protein ABPG72_009074 [Tetrahymena utriculariae]
MSSLCLSDLNVEEICHDLFTFTINQEKQNKSQKKNDEFIKQNGESVMDQPVQSCKNLKQWYQLKENQFLDCSKIKINQEKEFIWDSSREQYLWYKNLVIPTIKISLPFSQFCQKGQKILAKMRCFKQIDSKTYQEVELTGEMVQELKDDKPLIFSGLKFLETTFISRSIGFYLVLAIEKAQSNELQNQSTILVSYVSDSIYVEARKMSKRLRSDRFTSNYLDMLTSQNKQSQNLKQDQKVEYIVSEIKELYELNSYLNSLNNEQDEKISPFILSQLFPNIIRVYISKKKYAQCKNKLNDTIVQTQQILNKDSAHFQQNNDQSQNESDCVVYLSISKSSKNQLLPMIQQIQQKLLRFKPQNLTCIFEKNSHLQQMYRQINPSQEIAQLIEDHNQIFNKHSTQPLKFSKAQKKITKIDEFLNQLEKNRSKVAYSYKEFIKQENQTFCKYTTTINLKDFPPFEPLLTKKIKTIANNTKFKKLNTLSQNEVEEKGISKDFKFYNKQIETEKNISIQSAQFTSFASPQNQMLQLDSTPLKISLSTEDLSTKLLWKESPKLSQDKQFNPVLNISQSSIFDEVHLQNKDLYQNGQNSYQTINTQENINCLAYLPLNMDLLEKQQNLIQQSNLNQNQSNYFNEMQQNNINQIQQINYNNHFNNKKIIQNQQHSFYLNQLSYNQQQKQINYFNQSNFPNLVSNLQQNQQQQIYFNANQQNSYRSEINMHHQYHNQNCKYSINEQKKQQYYGHLIPQQQISHQLLLDRNQQVQNIYQENLIKQQSGSISLIYI